MGRKPIYTEEERKQKRRESNKRWCEAHKEHLKEYSNKYYHENKLGKSWYEKYGKAYYEKNKALIKERNNERNKENSKRYYLEHREEILEQRKKKYEKDKALINEYSKRYYLEHREEILNRMKKKKECQ